MAGFEYVLNQDARLLFVDDDPILREFAQVNLSSPTVCVDLASNGGEALDLLEAGNYDAMLLDLEMPVLNGFDTLAHVRNDARCEHLAVIVQTGREDIAAIDEAFRLGATSFVTKPLNWRLLSYQIRFIIRASRAEADLRYAAQKKRA
jgi:DNA-binding response OmpR family regulator